MGGFGSVQSMNTSRKNNRAQLSKRHNLHFMQKKLI